MRQFLQAGLVDFMHLVIVPITLGRGVSLWEGSSGLEERFTVESVTSPSGLTHQLWNKMTRSEPEPLSPLPRQTHLICTPQRRAATMPQATQNEGGSRTTVATVP